MQTDIARQGHLGFTRALPRYQTTETARQHEADAPSFRLSPRLKYQAAALTSFIVGSAAAVPELGSRTLHTRT